MSRRVLTDTASLFAKLDRTSPSESPVCLARMVSASSSILLARGMSLTNAVTLICPKWASSRSFTVNVFLQGDGHEGRQRNSLTRHLDAARQSGVRLTHEPANSYEDEIKWLRHLAEICARASTTQRRAR